MREQRQANERAAREQRAYCQLHTRILPDRFPVQPRDDMPVYQPPVVARRDGEALVCDCLHDGVHIWPDGDHVERDVAEPTPSPDARGRG